MILTCPECATSYFVDDSRIAASGRNVRCTSCGARWTAFREAAAQPETPVPEVAPPPSAPVKGTADDLEIVAVAPPEPPSPQPVFAPVTPQVIRRPAARREAAGKVRLWLGAAAVVAILIIGAVVFRREVVGLAPGAQRAYAGVGLTVETLLIENVVAKPTFEGGHPVLAVSGSIRNSQAALAIAPAIRIELLDRAGKVIAAKVAHPIDTRVPGHATRHFAISVADPPAGVHDMAISFDGAPQAQAAPPPRAAEALLAPVEAKPLTPGTPDALPGGAAPAHD